MEEVVIYIDCVHFTIVTPCCLMNYKERNEKSFAKKCVF